MIGQTVSHYEIREKLGGGGMGVVYLAKDTRLNREVAIKFLPPDYFGDHVAEKRFEREAKAAAALSHPHICHVYDVGEFDDQPYLVMERLRGQTLKHRLDEGRLELNEALKLATQIAAAFLAAHAQGIIHRDIKPANIFITKEGYAKVLDFGLAKRLESGQEAEDDLSSALTRAGATPGTLAYMSPEQVLAKELDARTDIFSFGVVLYEMITGVHPFRRQSANETVGAIIIDEPPPLTRHINDAPEILHHILRKMLAKEPGRRYSSMRDVQNDLERLMENASRAHSVSGLSSRRLGPGHWAMWAGLALLIGLVIPCAIYWPSLTTQPSASLVKVVEPVPLTTYPGEERQPTFSPDGSQVAFTWNGPRQDNFDIYVKVIGSEEPRRLTADSAVDASPAWSPDGRHIAFLRETASGRSDVRLISPNGGPERVLTSAATAPFHGLAWSADSRILAVRDRLSLGEPPGIFLLDTEVSEKRRLTLPPSGSEFGDWSPVFSSDSGTVAFLRLIGPLTVGVFLVPAAGGEQTQLVSTNAPESRAGLAWTSDDEEIIFTAPRSFPDALTASARFLWEVSAKGGQAQRLSGTEGGREVAVSREGSRLAYSQDLTSRDIWRIDLKDESKPPIRLMTSTKIDANPQFSPDGRQIAFTSGRSGNAEVWLADQDGSNLLPVTQLGNVGAVGSPRWSPDGKSVAFDHERNGNTDVYAVDSSGGPVRRITLNPATEVAPSWSRDGKWVYFASNRSGEWQVWKVPVSGEDVGSARQVTRQGGFLSIESTDGDYLYYSKRRSHEEAAQNAIWRIPVLGGTEEPVIPSLASSHTNWDVTTSGIYFVDRSSASESVWSVNFLNFADRNVVKLTQLKRPPFLAGPAFSVSPDGRWILSAQEESGSDLLLVENFR